MSDAQPSSPPVGGTIRRSLVAGLALTFGLLPLTLPLALLPTTPAHAAPSPEGDGQAALVDQEDQRLLQTRAVLAAILQAGGVTAMTWKQPQIYGSSHGKTLVLPALNTDQPYTMADLIKYGGKYVKKLPDGSYLLGIHVFVSDGASLLLQSSSGPLTLRMGSIPGAFSSIVSFGGKMTIEGTRQNPVRITSWDFRAGKPDTDPNDGRAYIRAVGGEFHMKYASTGNLGFWGGRTGGVALTGTDRPSSEQKHLTKEQRHANKKKRQQENENRGSSGGGPGDIEVEKPGGTATHVPAADLVTGSIDHSTFNGNAYGLFVSGSNQSKVTNVKIANSLVDGLVMHRFTKNATIENVTVSGSRGDGFVLARATEKIRVTGAAALNNGHNGFTVNGTALAEGPSASGESLETFGDSSINNSRAENNGHYGVELLGGDKLSVQNTQIVGGDMGIVVRSAATRVQISGNRLSKQTRQGISLRDGVKEASLAGNSITGARTGIYLRNSSGRLTGNVIKGATAHAITMIGNADGTEVRSNTFEGSGTSAISTSRADGKIKKHDNNTDRWDDTASLWMKARRYLKPMNFIWASVFTVVIVSMIRSRNNRRRFARLGRHPYALQMPMEERKVWRLPHRGDRQRGRPPAGPVAEPVGAPAGGSGGVRRSTTVTVPQIPVPVRPANPNGGQSNGAQPRRPQPHGVQPNAQHPHAPRPNGAPAGAQPNGAQPNGAQPNGTWSAGQPPRQGLPQPERGGV
ncbi:copper-binding protein NosD [Actinomadura pelletieri DSM 43383]|uniref:Copper-binding protein NosD n=1 Tax=Actinomadura pelletieri DSM 43383 TaxID=1120940 RepID=A0A495R0E6_9ACTN|nr:copper-binding protein NosD [Actinomadura pelletieri DSM 43383]